MTTIRDLSRADSVADGDLLPVLQEGSGRARAISAGELKQQFSAAVTDLAEQAKAAAEAAATSAASADATVLRNDLAAATGSELVTFGAESVKEALTRLGQFDTDLGNSTDPLKGAAQVGYRPGYMGAGSEAGDVGEALNEVVIAKTAGLCRGGDDTTLFSDLVTQIGPGTLIFSRGSELRANIALLQNVSNLTLEGQGALFTLLGTSPDISPSGFRLGGNVTGLKIRGFRVAGDPTNALANRHGGLWCPSGTIIDGLEVSDFRITDVMNGISVNTNSSGSQKNIHIFNGVIDRVRGTASGQGYGLHRADISTDVDDVIHAHHLLIKNCERHALYQARGAGFNYHDITIVNHRTAVATGTYLPAINVVRSTRGRLANIKGFNIYDGFVNIDKAAVACDDIEADGLKVYGIGNAVPPFKVGASSPTANDPDTGTPTGTPGRVTLRKCHAEYDGINVPPFAIFSCENLIAEANTCKITGTTGSVEMFDLYGAGETAGTATYSKRYRFAGNRGEIAGTANTRMFRFRSEIGASAVDIEDIDNTGQYTDVHAFCPAALSNPNIYAEGRDQTGYTFAAGVRLRAQTFNGVTVRHGRRAISNASITLAAGTTAAPSYTVTGVKAGDTVTVHYSTLGSLNLVIGTAHAIADDTVRIVIHNPGTSSLTLNSGTLTLSWQGA